jgi:importin subunit beta-1
MNVWICAGLVLKNSLDSKDSLKKESKAKQWLGLAEPVREQTKASLLAGLGAPEQDVRHTAALVIAKVAAIEIPRQLGRPDTNAIG